MKITALEEIMRVAWESQMEIPYLKMKVTKGDIEDFPVLENISIFKYESDFGPTTVELVRG